MYVSILFICCCCIFKVLDSSIGACEYPTHIVPDYPKQFWREHLQTSGSNPFTDAENYKVFRNVKDFGAKGDGVTDDTNAIQQAISSNSRCSAGIQCTGSTSEPGLVYFPQGTYLISTTIEVDYYTHLVGDPIGSQLPTLKCSNNFNHGYVIDADPYQNSGHLMWPSTDNFYREIRNLRIDMTGMNPSMGINGIHWPVGQATNLQNILFQMSTADGNNQQGIFMEEGSGGFMTDLVFIGGKLGALLGSQQFTSRNMSFYGCKTAIHQIWNWSWLYKSLSINNCDVGIELSVPSGHTESVGGITVLDSHFYNTKVGIITSASEQSLPPSAGQILLDNVNLEQTPIGIQSSTGQTILDGNQLVKSWGQGHVYTPSSSTFSYHRGTLPPPNKPAILLDGSKYLEHSRQEYFQYSIDKFVTVKSQGAKGDGVTDDTAVIQKIINTYAATKIIFFDAGVYLHTSTVFIPSNAVLLGEVESVIMGTGSFFSDPTNPKPVWSVGQPGQTGNVQIVDLLFSNHGPIPGGIMLQWNLQSTCPGKSGLWSTHFRTGGAKGTNQSPSNCLKLTGAVEKAECQGAFLQMHITPFTSLYMENNWLWTSDHNLDYPDHSQIDVFNTRTFLIESQGPLWMYGTASEHSTLYQYYFHNAKNILVGQAQTETAYYQSNPPAPKPFNSLPAWADPVFNSCPTNDSSCTKGWAMDIFNSTNIFIYNAGLYSFFQTWSTDCIGTSSDKYCQDEIFRIRGNSQNVFLWNLETIGVQSMVDVDNQPKVKSKENIGVFSDGILGYLPAN
jgi:hypothetical protein